MGRAPSAQSGVADAPKDLHPADLLRSTYLILPPSLGRHRRARIARAAVAEVQSLGAGPVAARQQLVGRALSVGPGWMPLARRKGLAALTPAARAAYVLTRLEGMEPEAACAVLGAAGVRDAATALALADRAGPPAAEVRAIEVPPASSGRRRFVLAGATAAVLAITVPLVALQGGDGAGDEPTTRIAPVVATEPTSPAPANKGTANKGTANKGTANNGTAKQPAADPATAEVRQDLDRILRRLTAALADAEADGPEAARLLNLIAAVQREQQRLRAAEPR